MEISVSLIHSGLTQYDLENRYIGFSDEPLCEEGILQLSKRKEDGYYPEVDYVYTGNSTRCIQTASIIYTNKPAVAVAGLIPYHFSDFSGMTYFEMEQDPEFKRWVFDVEEHLESKDIYSVIYRNIAAFRAVMSECVEREVARVAVVAHRLSILAIIRNYCIPRPTYREIQLNPGDCIRVTYNNYRDSAKILF